MARRRELLALRRAVRAALSDWDAELAGGLPGAGLTRGERVLSEAFWRPAARAAGGVLELDRVAHVATPADRDPSRRPSRDEDC